MTIRVFCIGDVVGRPGRQALADRLPRLVREKRIDVVIANAENVAGGSGITPTLVQKLRRYGVDVITLGDHAFRKMEIIPILEQNDSVLRAANLPPQAPGRGWTVCTGPNGQRVAVITLLGRLYMRHAVDCPFRTVDRILGQLPSDVRIVVVELHGEATSEKVAMGWHLDGRASVVFGTHTHIMTADERILPGGTAYITDLGMTGPYDSVLGRRKDRVLHTLLTAMPSTFSVATGDIRLCGLIADVDAATGRATAVERVSVPFVPRGGEAAGDGDEGPDADD